MALGVAASQGVYVKAVAWSGRWLSVSPPHKASVSRQVRGAAGGSRCRRLTRRLCEGRCGERQVSLGVAASQDVCVKAGAGSGRWLSVSPPHKASVYAILLDRHRQHWQLFSVGRGRP